MPTYTMYCSSCEDGFDVLLAVDDRDVPQECPMCSSFATERTMSAPVVLRASHQAGYSRGEGYAEMKRIAKLKVERANLPQGARDDVNKEIAGRTVVANKKKDKSPSKA